MNKVIQSFQALSNQSKILLFCGVFLGYYLLSFNADNSAQNLFIVLFVFIIYALLTSEKEEKLTKISDIDAFITKLEDIVVKHDTQEMVVKTVYRVHKPLKDLRYIKSSNEIRDVLYSLRYFLIYDKEDFIDIVIMIEYFLKMHFNVMIGKYDVETYGAILNDIRKEMLNAMYSSFFNIPQYSTTYSSSNLLTETKIQIKKIQAITYKYMKILAHKYQNVLKDNVFKGTTGIDKMRSPLYDMIY